MLINQTDELMWSFRLGILWVMRWDGGQGSFFSEFVCPVWSFIQLHFVASGLKVIVHQLPILCSAIKGCQTWWCLS